MMLGERNNFPGVESRCAGARFMSNDPREMVEPRRHDRRPARDLPAAANSENSLEGYAAVSGLDEQDEIARLAYAFYEQRTKEAGEGSAGDDWLRAEQEIQRRRST
jgi:hypothetical protein